MEIKDTVVHGTQASTFYISMTNVSTILITMYPYFDYFMF
jgi:hypothetical protein